MILNSIKEIGSINKDIAVFKKEGLEHGLIRNGFLIGAETNESMFTPSALDALKDEDSGLVIYKPQPDDKSIYILVKINNAFVFEFSGDIENLNLSLFKSVFESLSRLDKEVNIYSNIEKKAKKDSEDAYSLWVFSLPNKYSVALVQLAQETPFPIKSLRERSKNFNKKIVALCSFLLFVFFVFFNSKEPETKPIKPVKEVKKVKKYKTLKNFYTKKSNAPYELLVELSRQVNKVNLVAGWNVEAAYLTRNERTGSVIETIKLQSSFGELNALQKIVNTYGYSIDVESDIALISRTVDSNALYMNYARFHAGSFLKSMSSYFTAWFDNTEITTRDLKVDSKESNVVFKESKVQIANLYPIDLISIGSYLRGEPFSLEELTLEKTANQSFNLSIILVTAGVTNAN